MHQKLFTHVKHDVQAEKSTKPRSQPSRYPSTQIEGQDSGYDDAELILEACGVLLPQAGTPQLIGNAKGPCKHVLCRNLLGQFQVQLGSPSAREDTTNANRTQAALHLYLVAGADLLAACSMVRYNCCWDGLKVLGLDIEVCEDADTLTSTMVNMTAIFNIVYSLLRDAAIKKEIVEVISEPVDSESDQVFRLTRAAIAADIYTNVGEVGMAVNEEVTRQCGYWWDCHENSAKMLKLALRLYGGGNLGTTAVIGMSEGAAAVVSRVKEAGRAVSNTLIKGKNA